MGIKKGTRTAKVWQYFKEEIRQEGNERVTYVICQYKSTKSLEELICGHSLKYHSNTSLMRTHLNTKHGFDVDELKKRTEEQSV